MRPHVTPLEWAYDFDRYATDETYQRAASWLRDCPTVADWGGGRGYFRSFLPPSVAYTLVDGTLQTSDQVLAELTEYHEPSDGILLRHVLDCTDTWAPILRNALEACRQRLAVVTFQDGTCTVPDRRKHGWIYWHTNPADLRAAMGPWLVRDEAVQTSHAERVYYLERPPC
jgi:hypothetical protein